MLLEDYLIGDYDDLYSNYNRVTYDEGEFSVIDFNKDGNLGFE